MFSNEGIDENRIQYFLYDENKFKNHLCTMIQNFHDLQIYYDTQDNKCIDF